MADSTKLIEVVDRAIERLRQGWCQGSSARDVKDKPVNYNSKEACKWCVVGALSLSSDEYDKLSGLYKGLGNQPIYLAQDLLDKKLGYKYLLARWNDLPHRTQQEVLDFMLEYRASLDNAA